MQEQEGYRQGQLSGITTCANRRGELHQQESVYLVRAR